MKKLAFLLFGTLLVASCNSNDSEEKGKTDDFDRGAMLVNWADNIIIPSFENFALETQDLRAATKEFVQEPSQAGLNDLRSSYKQAYLEYQTVALFEVGEAETINYHTYLNIYPTNAAAIRAGIEKGDYNLDLASSIDEQGFPALDFLLNGLADTDTGILAYYTEGENAATYRQYLLDVSTKIDVLTDAVLEDWQTSFRDSFVANTSSSSTGSVDKFTNDFVMYFEMDLRSGKIGIPAGAFSGNPVPETAEAYYSEDFSKQLYLKALASFRNFFNGKHFNDSQTGPGYRQYLEYLNSIRGGEDIAAMINQQMNNVVQQADALDADLAEQVRTDNTAMLAAFDELQKVVVLLKIDMMQALDISVDYVDSDGD